jgi:hypothetical protein
MGIPVDGPANMFCDNESVVQSTLTLESTLKKKHISICSHKCQELQASGPLCVAWERGTTNLADLLN